MQNQKLKAALISNISNLSLVLSKLAIGFFSGSMSIISEAMHSTIDLVASLIAFIAIKNASEPPDKEHHYGHGKYEDISGLTEGILIFVIAVWIIYESILKMFNPHMPQLLSIGILVMLFSGIINYFVSSYLYKIAKKFDSIALEADALHLRTDVYTSFGVFIGLILIHITQMAIIDPIIAIMMALFIIKTSFSLVLRSFKDLTDASLPYKEEQQQIHRIVKECIPECSNFHALRTRKAGAERHIDLHLEMPLHISVQESHDICDMIEKKIVSLWRHTSVIIHVEPCNGTCDECKFKEKGVTRK